jgi:outer membrane immunogenic protein
MRNFGILLLWCASLLAVASAQNTSSASPYPSAEQKDRNRFVAAPVEIFAGYSNLRANQGPGQCGCFNMNGGSIQASFHVNRGLSAVADLSGEHSGSINNGPEGLSLISFTVGPGFTYPVHRHYALLAHALFGAVHGFDSSFPVASRITAATNSFALIAGGGLDIRLKSRLAVRPIQADYLLTHLPNGLNNRQNSLRLSAGVVLHFW